MVLGIRWYYSPAAKVSPWKVTSIIYQIRGDKHGSSILLSFPPVLNHVLNLFQDQFRNTDRESIFSICNFNVPPILTFPLGGGRNQNE
jgi:hypothetical protein